MLANALHPPKLAMRNVSKRFGAVQALCGVDLEVARGEIHALVGENGAGKTTLMRILCGLERADTGTVELDGRPVHIPDPEAAHRLGIGMVHQRFKLIPSLTVAENVILGSEPHRRGVLDRRAAYDQVIRLCEEHHLEVDPGARVGDLSIGLQQRVEILRLLYRKAQVLIFDEPTAVLTPQETEQLFEVLRALKEQGATIIYISHKLWEVLQISDRVTVLRRGVVQRALPTSEADAAVLTRLMVGQDVAPVTGEVSLPAPQGEPVLALHDVWATDDRGLPALRGVSLTVAAGEIVGVAGVEGNGQRELAEVLVGTRPLVRGSVTLLKREISRVPTWRRRLMGLGVIPEDRDREGVSLDFSLADNAIATRIRSHPFSRRGFLSRRAATMFCRRLIDEFNVVAPGPGTLARSLSGGNLQKFIAGRELSFRPTVLVAAHPTRGVDVGATRFLHERLLSLRNQGSGILLISGDLDEILALSDRIAVIFRGSIAGVLNRHEATRDRVGALMLGRRGEDSVA